MAIKRRDDVAVIVLGDARPCSEGATLAAAQKHMSCIEKEKPS
jgi:hypothetical protein